MKVDANVHVVRVANVGLTPVTHYLDAHPSEDVDWRLEGHTTGPGMPCRAISVSRWDGDEPPRCAKASVLRLLGLVIPDLQGFWSLALCGGHYAKHRSGQPLPFLRP